MSGRGPRGAPYGAPPASRPPAASPARMDVVLRRPQREQDRAADGVPIHRQKAPTHDVAAGRQRRERRRHLIRRALRTLCEGRPDRPRRSIAGYHLVGSLNRRPASGRGRSREPLHRGRALHEERVRVHAHACCRQQNGQQHGRGQPRRPPDHGRRIATSGRRQEAGTRSSSYSAFSVSVTKGAGSSPSPGPGRRLEPRSSGAHLRRIPGRPGTEPPCPARHRAIGRRSTNSSYHSLRQVATGPGDFLDTFCQLLTVVVVSLGVFTRFVVSSQPGFGIGFTAMTPSGIWTRMDLVGEPSQP